MNKPNILIIDDDKSVRNIVINALKPLNADIIESEDGFHALQIIRRNPVDVIISDQKMTGLALMQEIKKEYPDIIRLFMRGIDIISKYAASVAATGDGIVEFTGTTTLYGEKTFTSKTSTALEGDYQH